MKDRQSMDKCNLEARSRKRFCCGKAASI